MHITDHHPVVWNIMSISIDDSQTNEVRQIDRILVKCILELKQSFFFGLADLMKDNPVDFIAIYEQFIASLQERCTCYHMIRKYRPSLPQYLVHIIQ